MSNRHSKYTKRLWSTHSAWLFFTGTWHDKNIVVGSRVLRDAQYHGQTSNTQDLWPPPKVAEKRIDSVEAEA